MPLLAPVAHWRPAARRYSCWQGYPPFAGPVVRFHRLPAKLFARQAKQVAGRMQTSMQLSRGGINFHLHFTEGRGCDRICSTLSPRTTTVSTSCPAIHPRSAG